MGLIAGAKMRAKHAHDKQVMYELRKLAINRYCVVYQWCYSLNLSSTTLVLKASQFMWSICQFIQKKLHYASRPLFKCLKRRYFVGLMSSIINFRTVALRLPKYTSKDNYLFWTLVPLLAVLLNISMFSSRFFTNGSVFIFAGITGFVGVTILWFILNYVARLCKTYFVRDRSPVRRLATTIILQVTITALVLTIIHWAYDRTAMLGYHFNESRYSWALFTGIIANIFITLLNEGLAGFENWKATMIETEQLKKEYMQSQLLGLKSQVNPHFLFNSLNSLSSLISEDGQKAEKFLDEMSKVYRYLLRNSDDQLVTLETELQFVKSYFYLLKARYSDGIQMSYKINDNHLRLRLPPLTLQMLVEAAYNQNTVRRDRPLRIEIESADNGWLRIKNNIEKKIVDDNSDQSALENVANKFRLLCQQNIVINKTSEYNIIELPLIPPHEKQMA